jgi:hypothetical protein
MRFRSPPPLAPPPSFLATVYNILRNPTYFRYSIDTLTTYLIYTIPHGFCTKNSYYVWSKTQALLFSPHLKKPKTRCAKRRLQLSRRRGVVPIQVSAIYHLSPATSCPTFRDNKFRSTRSPSSHRGQPCPRRRRARTGKQCRCAHTPDPCSSRRCRPRR